MSLDWYLLKTAYEQRIQNLELENARLREDKAENEAMYERMIAGYQAKIKKYEAEKGGVENEL